MSELPVTAEDIAALKQIEELKKKASNGKVKELKGETAAAIMRDIEELKKLNGMIDEYKSRAETLKNRVLVEIGENDGITYESKLLATWKSQARTTLDQTALKKLEPETYKKYAKTTYVRTFKV